jgi:hypothetical protein
MPMTIKELKEFIDDLDDDMDVSVAIRVDSVEGDEEEDDGQGHEDIFDVTGLEVMQEEGTNKDFLSLVCDMREEDENEEKEEGDSTENDEPVDDEE